MHRLHHILISRLLAGVAFGMFLILTPRVWIDTRSSDATEEIPVQMLEQPGECLWCNKPPANCDEKKTKTRRMWLNPDEPLPVDDTPCTEDQADGTKPSA